MSLIFEWYEVLASVPYLVFAAVWLLVYLISSKPRKAVHAAIDTTFIVLVGSVSKQLLELTDSEWGGWLLIFLLLLAAGVIGRRQDRREGEVRLSRLYKWLSRPGFFVLVILYIFLIVLNGLLS
jgi:hypothetical protein